MSLPVFAEVFCNGNDAGRRKRISYVRGGVVPADYLSAGAAPLILLLILPFTKKQFLNFSLSKSLYKFSTACANVKLYLFVRGDAT